MKKVIILGGGISGLAVAWYLSKKDPSIHITLIEKGPSLGGWIQTHMPLGIAGPLFERGPRALRNSSKELLDLIEALDLKQELIEASALARRRSILINKRLVPINPFFFFRKGLLGGCLKEPFRKPLREEVTIAEFFHHRFGETFTDLFIDPLIRGIFGGNCHELSMSACLPSLLEWQERYRSLVWGALMHRKHKKSLLSFREGMQTLPSRLFAHLETKITLYKNVTPLKIESKEKIKLHLSEGLLEADLLISTIPSYTLHPLLDHVNPFLENIPYQSITVANIAFERSVVPTRGFGFLVPSSENSEFLGMSHDSDIFPEHNREAATRVALMYRGEQPQALTLALQQLQSLFKITDRPLATDLFIAQRAIPQYQLGHADRCARFSHPHPRLLLAGNYLQGVSIAHCLQTAKAAVERI